MLCLLRIRFAVQIFSRCLSACVIHQSVCSGSHMSMKHRAGSLNRPIRETANPSAVASRYMSIGGYVQSLPC